MSTTLLVYGIIVLAVGPLAAGLIAIAVGGRVRPERQPCPALLFHSVPQTGVQGLSYTTAATCRGLLEYLHAHEYTTLTVDQACDGGARDARRPIVLTFDDAFEDFCANVLPVLERLNMRVTLFPIVNYIGRSSTWDIYKPLDHLSAAKLREIAGKGHEIGSHTLSHPDLLFLSREDVRHELHDSRQALEDIVGKPIRSLSFPYGRWNGRIWQQAQECGYVNATVYGNHIPDSGRLLHVEGTYSFDTLSDLVEKVERRRPLSNVFARSRIMPHFAKGSPVWLFRKNYHILRGGQ
ncbi:MAG: polysaccharide deacetylase family protein [Chitinivibrionales bacterium]|nr:polysaccharide deacetylase family protein [Chitinivibrionales bacterium]MBD3395653.1 polysaccharide deacetylase family protein [Chitinivibrionales bacterium]